MSRVAAIAILSALLAACGGERAARASAEPAPVDGSAASEPLPPEIAQLLLQGPGGAVQDDFELDLEGDRPLPLRIVLEPPAH